MPELKQQLKQSVIEKQREMFPEYKYNDELRNIWRDLIEYFTGNYKELNPNKGLLFVGPIGCGKTTIFQILKAALKGKQEQFNAVGTWTLADEYQSVGMKFIGKYLFNEEILRVYNRETPINLFIDDLGSEAIVSHSYGDKRNVVNDIILRRYELYKEYGVKTHGATNLTDDLLFPRYEPKVVDRMKEMFNIVYLSNGSWRK